MSSSLLSFLAPQSITEKLPEKVMPSGVSSGSVVTFRNRVRYLPTSGTEYNVPTGSKIIQFRITGNDYLDMATALLHFRLNITTPTGVSVKGAIQEGIYSIIQRCRASLNSVIVQDTDNANVCANIKVVNTMPRQVYDSADGQYLGLYKKALTLGDSGPVDANMGLANFQQVSNYYYDSSDAGSNTSFYIPLSLICPSIGALKTFLPLRNVGNLELTFFLEDPSNCIYDPTNTASPAYSVTDVSVEVDAVQLASSIVQLYDRMASDVSESSGGVTMPVTVDVVQNINYTGSGQKSVSISRGTTALTQLSIVKRLQADLGVVTKQVLSTFFAFAQSRSQVRLGSRLYPTTASDSFTRMFTETRHAFGMLNNAFAGGLHTRKSFETAITDQSSFTYAYNFRRVLTEELGMDGENSIQSGSIIQYDLTDTPSGDAVLTAVIESLRYIKLQASSVNVVGL